VVTDVEVDYSAVAMTDEAYYIPIPAVSPPQPPPRNLQPHADT